jgi:hypothetical protein
VMGPETHLPSAPFLPPGTTRHPVGSTGNSTIPGDQVTATAT